MAVAQSSFFTRIFLYFTVLPGSWPCSANVPSVIFLSKSRPACVPGGSLYSKTRFPSTSTVTLFPFTMISWVHQFPSCAGELAIFTSPYKLPVLIQSLWVLLT